jgi:hypothetical protein
MNFLETTNSLVSPQAFVAGLFGTWVAVATSFVASLAFCILFVFNKSWHGALIIDAIEGIQKFHSAPTLQIGGLAIVAA